MRGVFILLLFVAQSTFAQFNYTIDQSIPVSLQDETILSMPWVGGLNATQFNTIDLNDDGKDDLAIFDRTANRVVTFLNDNNTYRYAPEYEPFFPALSNYMLLRDFNGDGRKDIFTSDNGDIRVYTNITSAGENLSWKLFYFSTGFGSKTDVLLSLGLTTKINVHMNADDLPAISDADGDGDLDLFVPRYPSGSTIEFHKNLSVENYGTLDSLDFARTPQTPTAWGGVTECDCGEFAFHDQPCNTGGRIDHAGGKSLFAFDVDQDGDQDMLLSESECNQLFLLRNEGTNATPVINQAVSFPSVLPAAMATFPTAFYEDVNFDNKKDLLVTPNVVGREVLQTNFKRSVWFYRNTGSTGLPVFASPQTNFLQGNMIDVGDNAVPAFFDADGDSDLDLFVACYTLNFSASIFYYENVGAQLNPSYKLVTPDFMGLASLNFTNIKPSFADMNGDTKIDLAFTASNQAGVGTQLYYLPNSNGIGLNLSSQIVGTNFFISSQENICIADVNLDGKNDLLVGKLNGSLEYWQNTGSAANPVYTLDDNSFLGLGSSVLRSSPSCTTGDLDADGKADLIIGDQTARGEQAGKIMVVSNYREATDMTSAVSSIIYNPLSETFKSQNLGGKVWPTIANIFKNDKPSIIVGNTQGGLHILKHTDTVPLPEAPTIDVYPNPVAKSSSFLNIKTDRPAGLVILSLLGQEMQPPIYLQALQEYTLRLDSFSKGLYLLHFVIENRTYTVKVAID